MSNNPVRVLYVNGGTMDMGGISSYMMNYFRNIDKTKVSIDFLVHGGVGFYDEEITRHGGCVFHVPTKKENILWNYIKIREIIKNGNYDIVHCHMDTMNGYVLRIAKDLKVGIRISHSHNTAHLTRNKIKIIIHEIAMKRIPKYATHAFACSEAAGKWLYGSRMPFIIIPNAIDIEKFKFNQKTRTLCRKQLGLDDKYVIGHIGRFDYQKNQNFLINVFSELRKSKKNAVLVLIGDGDLRDEIKKQIDELKLQDSVLLLGCRRDVSSLINIFDVFAFPSVFEGLGIVAIEAQANGLNVIASDAVPQEAIICPGSIRLPLLQSEWVNELSNAKTERHQNDEMLEEAGYNIKRESKKLEKLYHSLVVETMMNT